MPDEFNDFPDDDPDDSEELERYTADLEEAAEAFGVPVPAAVEVADLDLSGVARLEVGE